MEITTYSDGAAAEEDRRRKEEIERLLTPVADSYVEERLNALSVDDLQQYTPGGTCVGEFVRPHGHDYGFIGSAYVEPELAQGLKVGNAYAAQITTGRRGARAVRVAPLGSYMSWHHHEYVVALRTDLMARDIKEAEYLREKPTATSVWEGLKARADAAGFKLRRVSFGTASYNYGGRGTDTYIVEGDIDEAGARRLIEALGKRHASTSYDDGPYDHGHDRIRLIDGGFANDWCGPWTD